MAIMSKCLGVAKNAFQCIFGGELRFQGGSIYEISCIVNAGNDLIRAIKNLCGGVCLVVGGIVSFFTRLANGWLGKTLIVIGSGLLLYAFISIITAVVLYWRTRSKIRNNKEPEAGGLMELTIAGIKCNFRYCPPGSFQMGSPAGGSNDERQHKVILTYGFWLLENPVTNCLWNAVMVENRSPDNEAVKSVNWHDCQIDFMEQLNNSLTREGVFRGYEFRLPTEAEWEYACRAGGDEDRIDNDPSNQTYKNGWNLHYFKENFKEFCYDRYDMYSENEIIDPAPLDRGLYRAVRGFGSCRPASRDFGFWEDENTGFRLALVPPKLNFDFRICRALLRLHRDFIQKLIFKKENPINYNITVQERNIAPIPPAETQADLNHMTSVISPANAGNGAGGGNNLGNPFRTVDINGYKCIFRYCPRATFKMGSPFFEKGRLNDEIRHKVNLNIGFWIMDTPVTQGLWKAVMGQNNNPSRFQCDNCPVENVNWKDCNDFIKELNTNYLSRLHASETQDGLGGLKVGATEQFRLPTEAEWEYACRAGTTGPCAGTFNNMCWNWGNRTYQDPNGLTRGLGTQIVMSVDHVPNSWGLYEMHGNVWEWCLDYYADYSSEHVKDPLGGPSQKYKSLRVCRGGAWSYSPVFCRSASRARFYEWCRADCIGFRLVLGVALDISDRLDTSER